mgnify:CR=1 FL=1
MLISGKGQLFGGFLQFDVQRGAPDRNLDTVRRELELCDIPREGRVIMVLPELWATGFDYDNLPVHAARTPEILGQLTDLAGRYNIHLAGSLPEHDNGAYHNTLYICSADGVVGSYRKQRLFAPMAEDRHYTPGDKPQPVKTLLGQVAGLVCYDLRFPELVRNQVLAGAQLLVVSAHWPAARIQNWRQLLQARAVENQMYVIGCNCCGETDGEVFGGHSMIIGPDGTILRQAEDDAATLMVALDLQDVGEIRSRFSTVGKTPKAHNDADKITDREKLADITRRYRSIGRKVVFTNGCFDILHAGHVTYLEKARKKGDCLVLGLNSDSSVRKLKGPERPVNNEQARARVLAALGCIDHVVLFAEQTPIELIKTLKPDVLVKGGDWPVEKIVGAAEVLENGGQVFSIDLVDNFSTTSLIEKIQK